MIKNNQKIGVYISKEMNKVLNNLKENDTQLFLGKGQTGKNAKRLIDMMFLSAARAIYLKQSFRNLLRSTKTHDHILKNLEKDLNDSDDLIFLSQLIAYYSELKARKEDPHHIIFEKQKCFDIVRSYFELGWNLGSPSFQDIIEDPISPQNKIISELIDIINKNTDQTYSGK